MGLLITSELSGCLKNEEKLISSSQLTLCLNQTSNDAGDWVLRLSVPNASDGSVHPIVSDLISETRYRLEVIDDSSYLVIEETGVIEECNVVILENEYWETEFGWQNQRTDGSVDGPAKLPASLEGATVKEVRVTYWMGWTTDQFCAHNGNGYSSTNSTSIPVGSDYVELKLIIGPCAHD